MWTFVSGCRKIDNQELVISEYQWKNLQLHTVAIIRTTLKNGYLNFMITLHIFLNPMIGLTEKMLKACTKKADCDMAWVEKYKCSVEVYKSRRDYMVVFFL